MATKTCVVCGAGFYAPPSSKKITCSKECSSVRKTETHKGKTFTWGDEARAEWAKRGKTPNLQKGDAAAKASPIAGAFETNQEAKIWTVITPEGRQFLLRNLRKWCRENAELFAPDDWQLAYAGLRQVQAWFVGKRKHPVTGWKGWTLAHENRNPLDPMSKICRGCKKEFIAPEPRRRYCSDECKIRHYNQVAYLKSKRQ